MTSNAFDTSQVKDKRDAINGRFGKIKSMAAGRRAKLNESHRLHQFFRDLDDEESWIKYGLYDSEWSIIFHTNCIIWDCTLDIINSLPLGKRSCWWARRTTDVIWQEYRIWGRNTSGWRLSLEHTSRPFRWGVTCNMVAYKFTEMKKSWVKWIVILNANSSFVAFQSVLETGKKLSDDNTIGQEEIQQRLAQFVEHWRELKDLAAARSVLYFTILLFLLFYFSDHIQKIGSIRFFFLTLTKILWLCILPRIGIWTFFGFLVFSGQRLEESLEYQQFVANVEEEEAWINEKLNLVGSEDYGDTLAAVQVWKNKPKLADYGLILDIPSYCCLFVF